MTSKRITGYNFIEFLQLAQASILEGYRFDFESNDNIPQKFGNVHEAVMISAEEEQVPVVEVQETKENLEPQQEPVVTRKKRGSQT